jgi:hypothetical protein
MKIFSKLFFIAIIFAISSCASISAIGKKPIDPALAKSFNGKTLTVVNRNDSNQARLEVIKNGIMVEFGGVEVSDFTKNSHRDYFERYKLERPSIKLTEDLKNILVEKYGFILKENNVEFSSKYLASFVKQIVSKFKKENENPDYILDFFDNLLEVSFYTSSKYNLNYAATFRLIDNKTGDVVASGKCTYKTPLSKAVPFERFFVNKAEFFKSELENAYNNCLDEVKKMAP